MTGAVAAGAGGALVTSGALTALTAESGESAQQAIGYPSLFLLVFLGALVPVVPTGAVVSSATAVAFHHSDPALNSSLVFALATTAAFAGDALLFRLGRRGVRSRSGSRWLAWMHRQVAPEPLERARERLDRHGVAVLVVSRLLPAGRIPAMLACLLADLPFVAYLRGNLPAVLAWTATYQVIGLLGGALFPHPWQGAAAAAALTLLIAAAPAAWRRVAAR